MRQKHTAAAVAVVLVLLLIAFIAYSHNQWMKKNCVCSAAADGFHGWRGQHYTDNPYNGQNYQCGKGHADPRRDRLAIS